MEARHFTVYGRVQGVGFRWFTRSRARSLGLCGWVRNMPEGSVEVWAEGDTNSLNSLESHLKRGPSGSRVERVVTNEVTASGDFSQFDYQW
jgi:acylphosphatase